MKDEELFNKFWLWLKFLIASFTVEGLYGEGNAAGLLSLVVK